MLLLLNIFSNFPLNYTFLQQEQKQGKTNKEREEKSSRQTVLKFRNRLQDVFPRLFLSNQFTFPVSLPRFYFVITRLYQSKIPSPLPPPVPLLFISSVKMAFSLRKGNFRVF